MKKVLIIDDDKIMQESWRDDFEYLEIDVLAAFTLEEARKIFKKEKEKIDLIIMDACLISGEGPSTLGLTAEIRKDFSGPIMANSSEKEYQELLLKAGCDCTGDKSIDLLFG